MNDYILFMHNDATDMAHANDDKRWNEYISMLRGSGQFEGGSSIGAGECLKKNAPATAAPVEVTGFIQVRAASLQDAKRFLVGNPVYEAGGTVEVRELPRE